MHLWAKNPGDTRQTQNANTCGNAGTPCLTQRSFLVSWSSTVTINTEMGWWPSLHQYQPPPPSPLAQPCLALASHLLLSKMPFHLHFQQVQSCLQSANHNCQVIKLPHSSISTVSKSFFGAISTLFGMSNSISVLQSTKKIKMIKKELHQVPLTATKILKKCIPRTVLTCTSPAQTWIKTAGKQTTFFSKPYLAPTTKSKALLKAC